MTGKPETPRFAAAAGARRGHRLRDAVDALGFPLIPLTLPRCRRIVTMRKAANSIREKRAGTPRLALICAARPDVSPVACGGRSMSCEHGTFVPAGRLRRAMHKTSGFLATSGFPDLRRALCLPARNRAGERQVRVDGTAACSSVQAAAWPDPHPGRRLRLPARDGTEGRRLPADPEKAARRGTVQAAAWSDPHPERRLRLPARDGTEGQGLHADPEKADGGAVHHPRPGPQQARRLCLPARDRGDQWRMPQAATAVPARHEADRRQLRADPQEADAQPEPAEPGCPAAASAKAQAAGEPAGRSGAEQAPAVIFEPCETRTPPVQSGGAFSWLQPNRHPIRSGRGTTGRPARIPVDKQRRDD